MNNISNGSVFERDMCALLSSKGFWCHQIARTAGGQQPADIIAIFGDYHVLIDAKVVSTRGFQFSRVEDNQRSAMHKFQAVGGECGWFALKVNDNVYMLSLETIEELEEKNKKSISIIDIIESTYCLPFSRWLNRARAMGNMIRR